MLEIEIEKKIFNIIEFIFFINTTKIIEFCRFEWFDGFLKVEIAWYFSSANKTKQINIIFLINLDKNWQELAKIEKLCTHENLNYDFSVYFLPGVWVR